MITNFEVINNFSFDTNHRLIRITLDNTFKTNRSKYNTNLEIKTLSEDQIDEYQTNLNELCKNIKEQNMHETYNDLEKAIKDDMLSVRQNPPNIKIN